jgi:hypothetical protein
MLQSPSRRQARSSHAAASPAPSTVVDGAGSRAVICPLKSSTLSWVNSAEQTGVNSGERQGFPDGLGGNYLEGTFELTIMDATGIYRDFKGGHNLWWTACINWPTADSMSSASVTSANIRSPSIAGGNGGIGRAALQKGGARRGRKPSAALVRVARHLAAARRARQYRRCSPGCRRWRPHLVCHASPRPPTV